MHGGAELAEPNLVAQTMHACHAVECAGPGAGVVSIGGGETGAGKAGTGRVGCGGGRL